MLTDYHLHLRPDDVGEAAEYFTRENVDRYLAAAEERGIAELGVSEHVYRFRQALEYWRHPYWEGQAHDDLDAYCEFVRGTPLKLGLEADFVPGAEDRIANLLDARDFDYVVGSVHFLGEAGAVDDSRYDVQRVLPQWPARFVTDREVGPIGALTVNDGFTGPSGAGPASADPALNAAAQLARLLQARGVSVGPAARDIAPAGTNATTIATLTSPPLRDVLTAFLASSDNLTGEVLVREVAVRSGRPGTTANGVQAIAAKLAALGLPTTGLVMTDGSGLAREDRMTCALLLAVLGLATDPRYATLHDGLAIAGERGTLAERLRGTALQGKLVAKTGSLAGVSGLAGFVELARPVRFALLLNGQFPESTGIALREQVARTIAGYPDAPPPEVLVPQPLSPTPPSRRACPSPTTAC